MATRRQWLEKGYVICRNAIDVEAAAKDVCALFPRGSADPIRDFGNDGSGEFPSVYSSLNMMTVHPFLLRVARECLGTHDIVLTQSVAWAKYGQTADGSEQDNDDQRIHMDFGNHYWGEPPTVPDMIAAIVYYSDTSNTGGGTAVVPQLGPDDPVYQRPYRHMPGLCGIPFVNNRTAAEKVMAELSPSSSEIRETCYAREEVCGFKPGDVLFYRMTTWHRGTPVRSGEVRHVHNLAWRRKDAEGIQQWNRGYTRALYALPMQSAISTMAPDQLETLGFPSPTSPKWLRDTFCAAVRARYEWAGFRLDEYVQTTAAPPPVPPYWPFSHWTMTDADANALRTRIFAAAQQCGVCVTLLSADWRYKMECCVGPLYLEAECHFFTTADGVIVDINLLDGDRREWWRIVHNMTAIMDGKCPSEPTEHRPVPKTPPGILTVLHLKNIDLVGTDVFYLAGMDTPAELIVPFLWHEDPKVVYAGALRLQHSATLPDDCSALKWWTMKPVTGYLERNIADICRGLLASNSRL